ncbi:MAG TPA: DUF2924 domain-containing protein [Microvirga sp.]|jgi:hypothetical protein
MPIKPIPPELQARIDRLADLSLDELKARFLALRGVPLPKFMRRGLMTQAVAHAIREAYLGGLDRDTQRRLDTLVRQIVPNGVARPRPARKIKPGTRLLREWRGRVHEVTVVRDGFAYAGETFRSLSEIARHITGTRWNGWTFFGLKKAHPVEGSKPQHRGRGEGQRTKAASGALARGAVHG